MAGFRPPKTLTEKPKSGLPGSGAETLERRVEILEVFSDALGIGAKIVFAIARP